MSEARSRRHRILVVDDDEVFCDILQSWLEKTYDVSIAHDGEEALRAVRESLPDLVLLDVMMPRLSGFSVAWVFRNDERYRGIPVIFMTAHAVSMKDAEKKLARANGHLLKPFTMERLSGAIEQHLPEAIQDMGFEVPQDPAQSEMERRISPRFAVEIAARFNTTDRSSRGLIRSLSPFGAYLQCEFEAKPGCVGTLTFEHGNIAFEGRCEVVYNALRDGKPGLGLQFSELTTDDETLLERVLAEVTPGSN